MIDIVNAVFDRYGFERIKAQNGNFYSKNQSTQEQYWLLLNDDIEHVLENQARYFEECKKLCSEAGMDKNVSMIFIWETDGTVPRDTFKRTKMRIEEDPYFFKKYVLGYSRDELSQLKKEIGDQDVVAFLEEKIVSKEVFDGYKNEPFVKTWQSLLYRIAIKVPFLKIKIGESRGLQSLFEEHDKTLAEATLLDLSNAVIEKLDKFPQSDIKALPASELYKALWPLFEGRNGD